MTSGWIRAYKKLDRFVLSNREIKIEERVTRVPQRLRDDFYGMFNDVRLAFLKESLPEFEHEINELTNAYVALEAQIVNSLGLEGIRLPSQLRQFLRDPALWLIRPVFDPLFHLLKGVTDEKTFQTEVAAILKSTYNRLYVQLYKKWAMLSILSFVRADKNYVVSPPPLEISARGPIVPTEPKNVPQPKTSVHISFEKSSLSAFIVPEVIVRSALTRHYLSFRESLEHIVSITQVLWTATERDSKRNWLALQPRERSLGLSNALLIFVAERLNDVSLVADADGMAQPDVVVEFVGPLDTIEKGIERVACYKDRLNPMYGIFLVSSQTSSDPGKRCRNEGINHLGVGTDAAGLAPITASLIHGSPTHHSSENRMKIDKPLALSAGETFRDRSHD